MDYFESRLLPDPLSNKKGWPWINEIPEFDYQEYNGIDLPKISIITPSYNQGQFIEETIRSVLLQGYPSLEYIVIDGGSTDNTIEILKKYDKFLTYISEPDNGQTDAINKGFLMSNGSILAYINSDDTYLPDAFSNIVDFFVRHPHIDMIYGDVIHTNEKSEIIRKVSPGLPNIKKILSCKFYIPQPTVFWRREIYKKIGLFDENLNLAMDYDYWLRIFLTGKIQYLHRSLASARMYKDAKSIALYHEYLYDYLKILDKIYSKPDLPDNVVLLRNKSYGAVYFFGGIEYLKRRDFTTGFNYTYLGIRNDPLLLFDPRLFWGIIVAVFGQKLSGFFEPLLDKIFHKFLWE